jgi:uncharacterized protein
MRFSVCVLLLLALPAAAAVAQEHPTMTAAANTVYAAGDGHFEAAPDTAVIQFNISTQEETAKAAYDHASRSVEQVRQVLRANSIEPKSAQFGFFSLQPVYDYKTAKRPLVGYRVTSDVTLKLKDFSKIAPILQQLSETDITETQTLNYTLEDTNAAKTKAVEDAYRRARESAEGIAHASGRSLGELSYASVDTAENARPIPMMRPMMAMAKAEAAPAPTAEFSPQNIMVTAHVSALFTLK